MTTVTDEGTKVSGVNKTRQQLIYHDALGRVSKTRIMNWEGTGSGGQGRSVYSAAVNSYDALDHLTNVRQYNGDEGAVGYQDTTMTYDGYGRLWKQHKPQQQADPYVSGSTDHSTYLYNSDDTISSVTDARGVTTSFGYNGRHLLTSISYPQSLPFSVATRGNVSYTYDSAGNRSSMSDGLGSTSYVYNQLSQLTSETRVFTNVGSFTLNYSYNLAGSLKQITDVANNLNINYAFDAVGRLSDVTASGTLYAGISNYASGFRYRAWGGLAQFDEGANRTSHVGYNARLQPAHLDVSGNLANQNYEYHPDGRLSFVHNTTDNNFDRSYFYDSDARLSVAKSGGPARGDGGEYPYDQTFGYDKWNNLTSRTTYTWDGAGYLNDSITYTNNRNTNWVYDADGRITGIDTRYYAFDAAGQLASLDAQQLNANGSYTSVSNSSSYDGDGVKIKELFNNQTSYYLVSTVLGGAPIAELTSSGQKSIGYVYANGKLLARQQSSQVIWKHPAPGGSSEFQAFNDGSTAVLQFDPLAANLPMHYTPPPENIEGEGDVGAGHFGGILDSRWSDYLNLNGGCNLDGLATSCNLAMTVVNMGAGYDEGEFHCFGVDCGGQRPPVSYSPPLLHESNHLASFGIGPLMDSPPEGIFEMVNIFISFETYITNGILFNEDGKIMPLFRSLEQLQKTPQKKSCTFNVNLVSSTHLSQAEIKSIQGEMNRLFASTGHKITINQSAGADANYTLNLTNNTSSLPPADRANDDVFGYTPLRTARPTDPGYQDAQLFDGKIPGEKGYVYMTRTLFTGIKDRDRRLIVAARVGLHELIHYLWQDRQHGSGIMRDGIPDYNDDKADFTVDKNLVPYFDMWCNKH